jgi:hypothetical protein
MEGTIAAAQPGASPNLAKALFALLLALEGLDSTRLEYSNVTITKYSNVTLIS